jgi:hypothetical protein
MNHGIPNVVFDPVIFDVDVVFDPAGITIKCTRLPDAPCVWNMTPKSEIIIAIVTIIAT